MKTQKISVAQMKMEIGKITRKRAERMAEKGYPVAEIADILGIKESSVRKLVGEKKS